MNERNRYHQHKTQDGYMGSFNDYGRNKGHAEVEDDYSEDSFPGNHKTKWYGGTDLGLRKDMDGEVKIIRERYEQDDEEEGYRQYELEKKWDEIGENRKIGEK